MQKNILKTKTKALSKAKYYSNAFKICFSFLFFLAYISTAGEPRSIGGSSSTYFSTENIPYSNREKKFFSGVPISGRVENAQGEALSGVSVSIKYSASGTSTDESGNFTIDAKRGDVLIFSFVGYKTQEVTIRDATSLKITLINETGEMEEVVVVGYGTQKRINLTGAVSTITGDELVKRPVTNAATMLQGQMPGIRIVQGTGQPGADAPQMRIRGQGTYSSAGSEPLVLIDGVPGNLSLINPNDIENVSILKDAASASIYGARAANGVVLITTKTGKEGKFSIDYSGIFARHTPTKMLEIVTNSAEYMRLFNEAKANSGIASPTSTYSDDIIKVYQSATDRKMYPNFDWLDYMFNPAFVQNHNLSLNGGASGTTYNISLGYVNQPGIMKGFNFEKFNFRTNVKSEIKSWATIGVNVGLERGDVEQPRQGQQDAFLSTLSQAPTYAPFLPDGRAVSSAYNFESFNKNMPAIIANDAMLKSMNYSIHSQIWSDIQLARGLNWYSKAAFNLDDNSSKDWRPIVQQYNFHTQEPSRLLDVGGEGLQATNSRNFYSNLFSYLRYQFILPAEHTLSLQAGYSQERNNYQLLSGYRQSFPISSLQELGAGAAAVQTNDGYSMDWALQSFFGRMNYSFLNRYLLEANVRYDGTSRIAPESRWGWFPSFSAGWRLTEETFIKNANIAWLDEAKIRASYGLLGNQNISIGVRGLSYPYPYQDLLTFTGAYPFDNTNLSPGIAQVNLANRTLKWESTAMVDIGADLELFNRRLSITYDWYRRHTFDILRGAQVTTVTGLNPPFINSGDMLNTGHEITVQYRNSVTSGTLDGLAYGGGFYFDFLKNRLIKFGTREIDGYSIRENNLPYNSFYMLEMIGVFQTKEEIDASPQQFSDNVQPGDFKYRDVNGDGVVDNDDRKVVPGRFPKFTYSFNGNVSWKNFDISVLFQGEQGRKIFVNGWGIDPFRQGSAPTINYIKNRWTGPGSTNSEPRLYFDFTGNSQNRRANTWYLRDASYLRLKNVVFGYTLQSKGLDRVGLNRARLFFAADNLLTFTPYEGLDPERAGDGVFAQYPQNRILSVGVNLGF